MSKNMNTEALLLFNEKVEKLEDYTLVHTLKNNKVGCTVNWVKDKGASSDRFGPNEESMDASILTLRFFIQDNEKCSIKNISEIYENLPDSNEVKFLFLKSRQNLNNFLDSASFFNIGGKTFSRREILSVFIYGGLSHANPDKKKVYDHWMNYPLLNDLITNEFVYIISNLIHFVLHFREFNTKLIEELRLNIND